MPRSALLPTRAILENGKNANRVANRPGFFVESIRLRWYFSSLVLLERPNARPEAQHRPLWVHLCSARKIGAIRAFDTRGAGAV